jgi:hypothetical protein
MRSAYTVRDDRTCALVCKNKYARTDDAAEVQGKVEVEVEVQPHTSYYNSISAAVPPTYVIILSFMLASISFENYKYNNSDCSGRLQPNF